MRVKVFELGGLNSFSYPLNTKLRYKFFCCSLRLTSNLPIATEGSLRSLSYHQTRKKHREIPLNGRSCCFPPEIRNRFAGKKMQFSRQITVMVISPKGREFARLLYKDTRCMDDVGMFSCRYYATVVWEGAGFEAT